MTISPIVVPGRRRRAPLSTSRPPPRRRVAPAPMPLVENPDILATIARLPVGRPPLVVGFAAETDTVVEHARAKIARKGCDLIVANDVSAEGGVMGGADNTVHLIRRDGAVETWPRLGKEEVARRLVAHVAGLLAG